MYNYIPFFSMDKRPEKLACWNMDNKCITIFLKSMNLIFGKKDESLLYHATTYLLNHETLHGVIQHQLEKDRWSGSFNPEFAVEEATDEEYKKVIALG